MAGSAHDTIFAVSSGSPPAGVAIVRTSGPHAFAAAQALAGTLPTPRRAALRALRGSDGGLIDRALLLCFVAPGTVTGEDIVEYQCHGGRAVVDALLAELARAPGLRLAEPGEFTRRALANGRIDLTAAEGLADLLAAETQLQRRVALERHEGRLRHQVEHWRAEVLRLSAALEVAIDYADEDDGRIDPAMTSAAIDLAGAMEEVLSAPRIERLRTGLRVVVAGPPNAGKSSLVNALARSERALVTPLAGTTRDVIEVPLALGDLPLILVDTAGLRDGEDEVERLGIARASRELAAADLILWLGDADAAPAGRPVLLVANKSDLETRREGIPVSATTGAGLPALISVLVARARDLLPAPRQLSLSARESECVGQAAAALRRSASEADAVLAAEELRLARVSLDHLTGAAGVEDLLDALFARFCLGK